uniref:DUF2188 domain-containing protein n=1 Tax=Streptomyces sp. NBC_01393 TaxID=2903851 RepID=A0AAU3I9R0_9ACTN
MENIKVLWTVNGQRYVSVVSYDRASAEDRVRTLEADERVSDIETVNVPPGDTVEVTQKPSGRIVNRKHTAGSQK